MPPTAPGAAVTRRRSLWRNRDFMLLLSGQAVSSAGTEISQIAFPLLILYLTGSAAAAGIAGALRALPYFFLSLPAGALLDRWDRKRAMVLCDAGRALVLGSIPLAAAIGRLTVGQLYLAALVEGTLFVFFSIAEAACLPQVVAAEDLPAAVSRDQAAAGTAFLLGPALGGALYGVGRLLPFLADALSYAVSVASLLLIRVPFQREREHTPSRPKLLSAVGEGVIWLWRQPVLFFMALLSGGINFLSAGLTLVVIVLAQRQGAPAAVIGLILAVAGAGSIAGSLLAQPLRRRLSFGRAIGATIWAFALLWPLYAIAPTPLALGVITALLYVNGPIYNVIHFSYRAALVPDDLQGRVNSVVRLIAFGAIPMGLALTGLLLQRLGPIPTVLVFGLGFLVLAIATTTNPHLRHARPVAHRVAQSSE